MHMTVELRAVLSIGERFSAQRNEVERALLSELIDSTALKIDL